AAAGDLGTAGRQEPRTDLHLVPAMVAPPRRVATLRRPARHVRSLSDQRGRPGHVGPVRLPYRPPHAAHPRRRQRTPAPLHYRPAHRTARPVVGSTTTGLVRTPRYRNPRRRAGIRTRLSLDEQTTALIEAGRRLSVDRTQFVGGT